MQNPPGEDNLAGLINIGIGQIYDEKQIVFFDRRIEKKRPSVAQFKNELRKESGSFMIEAFLTQTDGLNISVPVKNREGLAVFQDSIDFVGGRVRCQNIECIFHWNP